MTLAILGMLAWIAFVVVKALIPNAFYKAYFQQKQLDMGKNPKAVIRQEFPYLWWMF